MKKIVVLALIGLMIMGSMGCASDNKEKEADKEFESIEANTQVSFDDAFTDGATESATGSSTEELTNEEKKASKEGNELFQQFLNDELTVNGSKFTEIFADGIDFDGIPRAYYIDLDDDGEDELLVDGFYYGWEVYDIVDGEIKHIDGGCGTADNVSIKKGNGHYYVAHTDFMHSGRKFMELVRFDEKGEAIETIYIIAIYEGQDDYDENSTFYYYEGDIENAYDDANLITMKQYDDYMDSYVSLEESEYKSAWEE
ncbi:MAG: hypothetical protein K5792_10410 [Butyrivibrio sp.]|nr:hypothetical protein [Butyrivibrio sp.]